MPSINATHDPARRSWVDSAQRDGADFPIQNLPFGMFVRDRTARAGIAIGDYILDLGVVRQAGLLVGPALTAAEAAAGTALNDLMALDPEVVSALRARVSDLLRIDGPDSERLQRIAERALVAMAGTQMLLPCRIENYTDFLTSAYHTERHGRFKGLAQPVPPAFWHLPVAYHGRASSIRVSGTPVIRPHGQWKGADGTVVFGPVEALDFELEVGAFVGRGNALGEPIPIAAAHEHIFGYCLLNDWSAKSVQWWEQVLGPFLGKSFMSSISPWIVTTEALAPFRIPGPVRDASAPPLLPYLDDAEDHRTGGLDVVLEAWLQTARMRREAWPPQRLTSTHPKHMSWSFAQMLAHHSSNGCDLRPGDLIASGTVSGPDDSCRACLTEIASAGTTPLRLDNGETRAWLADGDEVMFRARAESPRFVPIGFGECRGTVTAARACRS